MKEKKQQNKKVRIEQNDDVVESKVLAHAIVEISKAARKLSDSGLNKKAIVLLVSADARVSKSDASAVLDSLEDLAKTYCR